MSKSFFLENAAYVPQEDRLWSALTGDDLLHPLQDLQAPSFRRICQPLSKDCDTVSFLKKIKKGVGSAVKARARLRRSARICHLSPQRGWRARNVPRSFRFDAGGKLIRSCLLGIPKQRGEAAFSSLLHKTTHPRSRFCLRTPPPTPTLCPPSSFSPGFLNAR